ncbi:hypothetical protein RYX36_009459, partial [Vicia faba]
MEFVEVGEIPRFHRKIPNHHVAETLHFSTSQNTTFLISLPILDLPSPASNASTSVTTLPLNQIAQKECETRGGSGLRFAYGAPSRLELVALKSIRVLDDDDNGTLTAKLEKQFITKVTLLSRLLCQN